MTRSPDLRIDDGTDRAAENGRFARAELVFARGGGRTVLTRQFVPYPFHVTRPFRLDQARPDLVTLYLQSASGGLYRADDLGLAIRVGPGAAAHVTTQAATIVHDTGAMPARQHIALHVAGEALLAFTPDPLVLFPGAALRSATTITVDAGARAIVSDSFTWHDPRDSAAPFAGLSQQLTVAGGDGACLVREAGHLSGSAFLSQASPLQRYLAASTTLILASAAVLPDAARLQSAADAAGCLSGVGALPNGAGLLVRALARDGSTLRKGLDAVFRQAFEALVGVAPALRPK